MSRLHFVEYGFKYGGENLAKEFFNEAAQTADRWHRGLKRHDEHIAYHKPILYGAKQTMISVIVGLPIGFVTALWLTHTQYSEIAPILASIFRG